MEDEKRKKQNEESNRKSRILAEWKDGYFKGHYRKEEAYKKAIKKLNKSANHRGIKFEEVKV